MAINKPNWMEATKCHAYISESAGVEFGTITEVWYMYQMQRS